MYSQATVSPALMHSLGLPSGLPWLKVSRARVIGSLKRAESSPPLGCSPGKHGTLSCLQGRVERILTQTAPVSLVLAGGRRNQATLFIAIFALADAAAATCSVAGCLSLPRARANHLVV